MNGYIKVDVNFEETFDMLYPEFYIHRGEAEDENGPRMDSATALLERMNRHIIDGDKDLKETVERGFENLGEKIDRGSEMNYHRFDRIEEKYLAVAEEKGEFGNGE